MEYSDTEFETLYRQCFPPAMRLAVSLLHEDDEARDVVQEVFVKLWESNIRIENPKAFIVRAVRNASLNRISMLDNREKICRRMALDPPPDDFSPQEQSREVYQAMDWLLTPRERQVVDKIYSAGLSYKETAETLDVSVAAINKNIVSALKKLRTHFKTHR